MTTARKIASLALSFSLVLASTAAFAGEKKGPAFPMAGDAFQQRVEARLEKQRGRMEEMLAKKNLPAEKASEIRARFDARKAKVEAAVADAVADGTVTREEARQVRRAAGGHGHERHEKKQQPA